MNEVSDTLARMALSSPVLDQQALYAIDYGTSNSLLSCASSEQILGPLPLDPHSVDPSIFRSVLYFPNRKECHFASQAIEEFVARDMEGRLIRSIKKYLPVASFQGTYIEERPMSLEDVIATFLREMKRRADLHVGKDINGVVLGRPAKFSLDEAEDRLAESRLEKAANLAGFKYIEFCPEPLAAAFSYRRHLDSMKIVLVADFGGGTSDFTVIRIGPQDYRPEDVLAIGGVPLAGDSLDSAMMRKKISPHFGSTVAYKVPFGQNVLQMPRVLMEKICSPADIVQLRERDTMEFFRNVKQWSLGEDDRKRMDQLFLLIEDQLGFPVFEEIDGTKRRLSQADQTKFEFRYPSLVIQEPVSRVEFEQIIEDAVQKILDSLDQTIADAGLKATQIDLVCSTGGTAKVPLLQHALEQRFGAAKISQHNHFQSVVLGLAERAQMLLCGQN